jgi:hypothetical protein
VTEDAEEGIKASRFRVYPSSSSLLTPTLSYAIYSSVFFPPNVLTWFRSSSLACFEGMSQSPFHSADAHVHPFSLPRRGRNCILDRFLTLKILLKASRHASRHASSRLKLLKGSSLKTPQHFKTRLTQDLKTLRQPASRRFKLLKS